MDTRGSVQLTFDPDTHMFTIAIVELDGKAEHGFLEVGWDGMIDIMEQLNALVYRASVVEEQRATANQWQTIWQSPG